MPALDEFDQHRSALFGLAYRMLGSVMDAEDIVQEAFLRWQNVSESEVRSPRAYLMTIVTRLCVDQLRLARVQREEYVGAWLPEPLLQSSESDPAWQNELDESISTAFLVLLESLSPLDRAVFLLHEVRLFKKILCHHGKKFSFVSRSIIINVGFARFDILYFQVYSPYPG